MNWEGLITISILLVLLLIIYSRVKNQSLRESYEEVKELFVPKQEEI